MKYENDNNGSTTLDPADELTLEEQRAIAGAAPLALPEERLDAEVPRQGWANSALPRTVFVGGIIGVVCAVALLFTMLFGGRQKVAQTPQSEIETPAVISDEADRLKTELALVGQEQSQTIPTPGARVRTPTTSAKAATPRTVRNTPPQPQFQPQTRIVTTRSAPSAPPATVKEPEIDPFEKWDNLANAGAMQGNVAVEAVQVSDEPQAEPVSDVKIASATLGDGSLPNLSSDSQQADLSPGANGILNRRPSAPQNNAGQIPIGAVAKAELMIPIVVAGGDITNSAVQLQESLKDEQGHDVLPTGTIFVTQITNVNESSRMIEQTAVGVRYKKNGQFVEEAIPPGLVLIVSRNLEPLQADRVRSRRGFNVAPALAQAIGSVSNQVTGGGNGVVSDLLGELASQVRRRSNSDGRVRDQTALSIKAGENVSVLVNGFLGVTP